MAPTSRSSSYVFFCVCYLLFCGGSLRGLGVRAAGNIDVLEPIVRISPVRGGSMPPANASDDYFGFSVALHQIRVPTSFDEALTSTRYL